MTLKSSGEENIERSPSPDHKLRSPSQRIWIPGTIICLILIVLLFPLLGGFSPRFRDSLIRFDTKLSPVLKHEVAFLAANPNYDRPIPVIVQVNPDFFAHNMEVYPDEFSRRNRNAVSLINAYTARLTGAQIKLLLSAEVVEYVTFDVPIRITSSHENKDKDRNKDNDEDKDKYEEGGSPFLAAIGADQLNYHNDNGYYGKGVVVALFDSGISKHDDLEKKRILIAVDFTSGKPVISPANHDAYGHGTAVAGIIGGTGKESAGEYSGVAPGVKFVDIKVIGEDGTGLTSNLIKAIEWVIENKEVYGIRVANLSVGHPPVESYTADPLCQAVETLVASGIVTVVSAGNLGKTEQYPKIWGAINSPGNDPTVITVGPVNTQGTATHSDDVATSYGSRGPTYQDNLFKPDLCAPGNQIPSLLAKRSWIEQNHPELKIEKHYIYLSGASMATPYVTGTVALMLEANRYLNPNLVKLILLLTAIKLEQPHMLEQGNGLVNLLTAVQLAEQVDMDNHRVLEMVSPKWSLDGEEVWSGGAFAYGDQIIYSRLVDADTVQFWGDGVFWADAVFWANSSQASSQDSFPGDP